MWQRFTEKSRRAVFFAQEEATRLKVNHVSTEHLLLGLLSDEGNVAQRVLAEMKIDPAAIRAEIARQVKQGQHDAGQDMQLTPRSKKVIDLAYEEAKTLNNNYIGTEHLLLGLIRENEGVASQVLRGFGIKMEPARAIIAALQNKAHDDKQMPTPPNAEPITSEKAVEVAHGDLGTAHNPEGRDFVEVAHDAATFIELVHVYLAHDAHGYRSLLQGDQTMFVVPTGTPLKRLVNLPESDAACRKDGYYVRVLSGDFAGYSGWIFAENFARTGPDEAPFPPSLSD